MLVEVAKYLLAAFIIPPTIDPKTTTTPPPILSLDTDARRRSIATSSEDESGYGNAKNPKQNMPKMHSITPMQKM